MSGPLQSEVPKALTALSLSFMAFWTLGIADVAAQSAIVEGREPPSIHTHGLPRLEDRAPGAAIVEVDLVAATAHLELLPGRSSDVFAYNGSVPGPLLEVTEGDSLIIHVRNDLPEATTIHWHGLHIPFVADGSPFHPIEPGGSFTYAFRIPTGSAGTYWYHPHPDHRAAYQVGMGLFGAIIVRDPNDPLPPLAVHVLVLSDNRFRDDGSIDFPEAGTRVAEMDELNGREGDVIFVGSEILPTLSIRAGEVQRWRIVNASGARIYRLALDGHSLLHVGSDGGLFEHPVEVDEILLANGERVELLVRGTGEPGSQAVLKALPYDRYMARGRPDSWNEPREILTLRYTDDPPVEPIDIPGVLRRIAAVPTAAADTSRTILLQP